MPRASLRLEHHPDFTAVLGDTGCGSIRALSGIVAVGWHRPGLQSLPLSQAERTGSGAETHALRGARASRHPNPRPRGARPPHGWGRRDTQAVTTGHMPVQYCVVTALEKDPGAMCYM